MILFLNPQWEESWGGNLELLENPFEEQCRSALPLANRAGIFETTEASWHGFRKIQLPPEISTSRRSIAVYFYTNEPPARGAAPSHATFYYQRPMPGHLRPGYTLTDADVTEMQGLMARQLHSFPVRTRDGIYRDAGKSDPFADIPSGCALRQSG